MLAGEYELGERKVAYDGTLDSKPYNNDFETFIAYNRQDVDPSLSQADKKLQFIDLQRVGTFTVNRPRQWVRLHKLIWLLLMKYTYEDLLFLTNR